MRVLSIALAVVGGTIVIFLAITALVKGFWVWTVPALFPGAVAQGLVARSLSWAVAARVALGLALLRGASEAGSAGTKHSRRSESGRSSAA